MIDVPGIKTPIKTALTLNARCQVLGLLAASIHEANRNWWLDLETGEPLNAYALIPEKLMLTVCELDEGMEGYRKNLQDDKLPHRMMLEVEMADAVIRILDLSEALGFDIANAIYEKLEYNSTREDHTLEHRKGTHGKKC